MQYYFLTKGAIPNMKFQNYKPYKFPITSIIAIIMITLSINLFPLDSKAKTAHPKWKKQLSSLEVGKTYRYSIKHCPKKATIQFSSNHPSLASINCKTGLFRAKKPGKVVITAKIKQTQKRSKKLKTHIRIIKKKPSNLSANASEKQELPSQSSILNHVTFSVADSVNPWNHSIMLYSSRILLQSEVQNTNLILTPSRIKSNPKINFPLTAHFSSLSADGKKITYQLDEDSSKKLCPGNGTSDGEYEITGNFFPNSLRTQYHERIHKNSLCGFVLNTNQTSLPNVSVKLYNNSQNMLIASTTTDSNGYYEFQNITDKNITLKAESENHDSYILSSLNPSEQNICQNIIMHPTSKKNLSVSCQILNKQNQAVKNTAVILTKKDTEFTVNPSGNIPSNDESENFFLQGFVDSNGLVSFANQENINANEYTQITYHSNQSLPEYFRSKMPVSDSVVHDSSHTMTRNQDYVLYVFPATNGSSIPRDYQMESFSFSFDPLLSDSLFLQIYLEELPLLSTEKVSIHSDTLLDPVSSYHYGLYDKKGNELFHTTLSPLSKDSQDDYSKQLTAALQYSQTRLTDGDYYAAVTAFTSLSSTKSNTSDKEETVISGTSILPIQIQNNMISSVSFTLSPCQTFHALTFIDNCNKNLKTFSFTLYQKADTSWFPIGTYITDLFIPIHSGQKAYLTLPISPNTSYCLVPSSTQYQISSGNYFTTSKTQSQSTEHQILLCFVPDNDAVIKNILDLSGLLDYINLCTNKSNFHKEFFSNSSTYPNTVYAHYETDGTFVNLFLATPSLSSDENISSTFIYDRLQNGKAIHTSQTSYSATMFFVT